MARDNKLDTLKGLLIILVILGHAIQTIDAGNFVNHCAMGFIYMFHMPLFTLISGYLTKSREQEPPRVMWRRILDIAATLLMFQAISVFWVWIDGGNYIRAAKSFPFGVLWYLLSMIYWRILIYYSPKALRDRPAIYLGIALLISVLIGFTRMGNLLTIQRAISYYPYFLLGYFYRQGVLNKQWWHNNKLHAAVSVVLLAVIFWFFPASGNVMNGADHYDISRVPEKLTILACSTAMCLFLFNVIRDVKILRVIGKDSMFYYLYHIFLVCYVLYNIVKIYDIPCTFPFMVLYTGIITLVLYLLSKIKFLQWLTHPTRRLQRH